MPPSRKYQIERDNAVWATGGYSTARTEITAAGLPPRGPLSALNSAIRVGGIVVQQRYAPAMRAAGLVDAGVYSLLLGFDELDVPRMYVNSPPTGQHLDLGPGQNICLSTGTEEIQAIANRLAPSHFSPPSTFHFDSFAIDVARIAAEKHPVEIGFPLELVIIRRGRSPVELSIGAGVLTHRSAEWAITIPSA